MSRPKRMLAAVSDLGAARRRGRRSRRGRHDHAGRPRQRQRRQRNVARDVDVGVAANLVANVCGVNVGPVQALASQVDATGPRPPSAPAAARSSACCRTQRTPRGRGASALRRPRASPVLLPRAAKASSDASTASRSIPRVMNTIREPAVVVRPGRRGGAGGGRRAARRRGRRAGRTDVEEALDPQHVEATAVRSIVSHTRERVPVERFVEDERERADVAGVAGVVVLRDRRGPRTVTGCRACPAQEVVGRDRPEGDPAHGATGFSARRRASSAATSAGAAASAFVTSSVSATAACLTDSGWRSRVAPADGVDGRHDRLDRVVVAQQRLADERRQHRRRVGQPGRLDHDPAERRELAARAAGEQVAQLVLEVAAQRAADAAAAEDDRALVDLAHEVMVDRDLAELVDEHRRLSHRGMREQRRDQGRLAAAEEAGDEDDADRSAIAAQGGDERRVERVERAAGEGARPRSRASQVVDDLGAALAVVEDVRVPPQSLERHAEPGQHAPHDPCASPARARAAVLIGPVLGQERSAQGAHW